MTKRVYVDQFPDSGWGRWNRGGHMLANDLEALHEMAEQIGLKRQWFQKKSSFAHYDLTENKRRMAIELGAIEIEIGHIPHDVLMRCQDGTYEKRSVRVKRNLRRKNQP